MAEYSKKTFFDFLIFLAKKKKIIISFGAVTLIISYLFIYFFIKPQFSSKSVIIPSETSSIGIGGLLNNFGDVQIYLLG